MLVFKRESISQAKAEKLLAVSDHAGFNNRNITASFVTRYAGDMERGNWESDTGETIKITQNGVVVDGQHRLLAVIKSGVSAEMWVCRGIEESMFQYIDQGNCRTLQDMMSIEGWDNPRELAVVGKMLWRYDRDKANNPYAHSSKFSESEGNIYTWVCSVEPSLQAVWGSYGELVRKSYAAMHKSCPISLLYYLLYQWMKEDNNATLLFFSYLSDGVATPPHGAMKNFREFCIEAKMKQQAGELTVRARRGDIKTLQHSAALYAWSLILSGKKSLTFNGFKSGLAKWSAQQLKAEI